MDNNIYTSRDVTAIRSYLIDEITKMTDKWTDFNESDLGMVFVEVASGVADMLGFYIDKQSLECMLPTVKQRKNAKALLSVTNYKMGMVSSSVSRAKFGIITPLEEDIIIPRYTQVSASSSNGALYFATKYATSIKAGELGIVDGDGEEDTVPLVQGIVNSVYLTVRDLLSSDKLMLLSRDIAQNSVIINIGGTEWTEVEDVYMELDPTNKFSVHENKNDEPFVQFSPDYKNFLPSDESADVVVQYLVSEGSRGVVQIGNITNVVSTLYTGSGSPISSVSVENIDRASGGADRETVEHARKLAPLYWKTGGVAITLKDYETLVNKYPGVSTCKAIDWTVVGGNITVPYSIKILVVPVGGGVCSEQHLSDIVNYLSDKKVNSMVLSAVSADYFTVNVSTTVYVRATVDKYESIRQAIVSSLNSHFSIDKQSFQAGVYSSTVSTVIQTSSVYIDHINLITTDKDGVVFTNMNLGVGQFPVLGDVVVNVVGV